MIKKLKSIFPTSTKNIIKFLLYGSKSVYENKWGISLCADVKRAIRTLGDSDKNNLEIVFDVGANIGQTSVEFAKNFPNSNIFAFEPAADTYKILLNSVENIPRIKTYDFALGAEISTKTLYSYGENSPLNSLISESPVMSSSMSNKSYTISVNTLDNFCEWQNINKIDLLKIDTEGFDFEVIKGASRLINNGCIKFIYFEFFITSKQVEGNSQGGNLAEIMDYLLSKNYRMISFYTDFVNPEVPNSHHNALMMLRDWY